MVSTLGRTLEIFSPIEVDHSDIEAEDIQAAVDQDADLLGDLIRQDPYQYAQLNSKSTARLTRMPSRFDTRAAAPELDSRPDTSNR